MKKLITTTIFALFFGMTLSAQSYTDGFFTTKYKEYREVTEWGNLPLLPDEHGLDYDYAAAPVGNGILLLGGMALVWLKTNDKRRKE